MAKGSSPARGGGASDAVFDADDLLPRNDISGSVTAELLARLGGSNWKDRKAALDDLDRLLAGAGGRVMPQVRGAGRGG